jgi:hypothetical protein
LSTRNIYMTLCFVYAPVCQVFPPIYGAKTKCKW